MTLICAGVMAAAPQFQQTGSLEGEVRPSEQALGLTVEIFDTSRRMVVDRTATSLSGQFLFRNLQLGDYQVRVTDAQGNVVSQEFVRVSGSMDHVSLQLPERRTDRPPQGTVSVQQLGRIKIPKAARKEFDKGVAAAGKSDSEGAIKHYRKALEIAPDYMEAHTNIAVRLLESQQTQEAVQHLERAVELDPGSSLAFTNLAAAYMLLQRLPEAERAARQAERLDPASARARYMLGLALANLRQTAEALRYLNTVVDEIPRARLALAQLMVDADKREEAVDQLRKYIASRDVRDRDKATSWLATLEAPQGESAGAPGNIRASNGGH
ncbi:MAG TPA: tetratricopeptide repeat protein [Bryobacteraceae bacterium]|nr:tetratricopeptide repeat protein [Bryobacteraceae bacterium]